MRKKLAEGFSPVYDKRGKILPGFEGLGPTYNRGKFKQVPKTPRTPTPKRTPFKMPTWSPKRTPFIKPHKTGKRYYA